MSETKVQIQTIAEGSTHLQNTIIDQGKCHICKKEQTPEMVLIRKSGNEMIFACTEHSGIVRMFIEQFGRPPLGWEVEDAGESNSKEG